MAERNPDQKRLNLVKRETNRIRYTSSAMNTCQAVVKPDCSIPKVLKSTGIKQAFKNIFMSMTNSTVEQNKEITFEKFVSYNVRSLCEEVKDLVKYVTIEFVGVKFKASGTHDGKKVISTYLTRHMDQLQIKKNLEIDIDSELYVSDCSTFTTPIRCFDSATNGFLSNKKLTSIKQSKGEAEMSQIDWLWEYASDLSPGDVCVSMVTSGDIDAVVLHLFFASWKWKRNKNGRFINPIYVLLHKPAGMFDIYNITGLLETFESSTEDIGILD
ncbi:hypothetical protein LOTGIDRAFT_164522 [Lottia gigantea]|uniref:Uncharacterized protein n=1 Tax=Lottia gigantea TaxID=225164 RepID=V4A0K6_LOTGI|nr:hypothetical protein LOTGIDRAFT_164522 [Lottia gigantea]ESO90207.1 hypothetical protein LOTGIDRAFT_164522 [Lottia gigantea]